MPAAVGSFRFAAIQQAIKNPLVAGLVNIQSGDQKQHLRPLLFPLRVLYSFKYYLFIVSRSLVTRFQLLPLRFVQYFIHFVGEFVVLVAYCQDCYS